MFQNTKKKCKSNVKIGRFMSWYIVNGLMIFNVTITWNNYIYIYIQKNVDHLQRIVHLQDYWHTCNKN